MEKGLSLNKLKDMKPIVDWIQEAGEAGILEWVMLKTLSEALTYGVDVSKEFFYRTRYWLPSHFMIYF